MVNNKYFNLQNENYQKMGKMCTESKNQRSIATSVVLVSRLVILVLVFSKTYEILLVLVLVLVRLMKFF